MSKLLGYILVALIAIGGTWYYLDSKDAAEDQRFKDRIEKLDKDKQTYSNVIDSLKKDTARQGERIRGLYDAVRYERYLRDSLEEEADKEISKIDSLPLDSVANIIQNYFGQGDHKIIKLDKGIYVAFSANLTREIGKGTLELQKLKKLKISYQNELSAKDSVITTLGLKSMKQDSIIDAVRHQLNIEESKGYLKDQRIENLVEKIKSYKLGIAGTAIVIIGGLVFIL